MNIRIDHVVISVQDLDTAVQTYNAAGFTTIYGGRHADGLTHNALILFADGSYLELLARVNPDGDMPLFKDLLRVDGEGYSGYALTCDDLDAETTRMAEAGVAVGEIRQGGRVRADGVELRWRMARLNGGMSPFIIQDETARILRVAADETNTRHANGALGIADVRVLALDLEAAAQQYVALTGSDGLLANGQAVFPVAGSTLTVAAPVGSVQHTYAAASGEVPYRITLAGLAQPIPPALAHGAGFEALDG